MSLANAKKHLAKFNKEQDVLEFANSSATVSLAAKALATEEARIAKTLAFSINGKAILIVAAGDVKVDNKKYKDFFKIRAKMLSAEELPEKIGHNVGGVCPFGINPDVEVYLDESLKRFLTVFPACGNDSSAIELNLAELFLISNAITWVDVCKIIVN